MPPRGIYWSARIGGIRVKLDSNINGYRLLVLFRAIDQIVEKRDTR